MNKFSVAAFFVLLCTTGLFAYKWYHVRQAYIKSKVSKPCTYTAAQLNFERSATETDSSIVILGNSLIRGAKWDSLLNRRDIVNKGISGDKLRCMCERVKYLRGKVFLIEGGINDIHNNVPTDSIVSYFKVISERLLSRGDKPIINLVIYVSPRAKELFPHLNDYHVTNLKIDSINGRVMAYAKTKGIQVVDMNQKLTDGDKLKDEYTTDGVHLTEKAYRLWADELQKYLS